MHLALAGLSKSFGGTAVVQALNLVVEERQFVSLLGPSGSGKTTILRCIAGLETPDAGSVTLGGVRLHGGGRTVPPEQRGIGMVFQNYAVWPHMSVFENVAFPLRLRREGARDVDARTRAALARVKLEALAQRLPHELSGGQQQRVALARALVAAPRLLLLDEPLSNLDAVLREELGTEIRRLARELGLTTVLVTHDRAEALALSDRIVVLRDGLVAADGAPEALYRSPPSDFVAEFLAGGQRLAANGELPRMYLPRRWRTDAGVGPSFPGRVETRIYRGSEYEYLAALDGVAGSVRFFAALRHDVGALLTLRYEDPAHGG